MAAPAVAVVGAGWSGATVARTLHDQGLVVHLYEADDQVGGHARTATINGVLFEPNGPHIFHTSNARVAEFVMRFGMSRRYAHTVLTEVFLDGEPYLLSWPPQVSELRALPIWPRIAKELDDLGDGEPSRQNLESHCVSIMGETLYRLFIRDYTIKQWGTAASSLAASFAPGRLELRRDDNRRLFRDTWEFFPSEGAQAVIETIARPVPTTLGQAVRVSDLAEVEKECSAIVVTAPLDDFVGRPGELEWRGIRTVSTYHPLDEPTMKLTAGYVINRPSLSVPYTRTVETKHATGQAVQGTVVSYEYPGSSRRHYPVPRTDNRNEIQNLALQEEIRSIATVPVAFCGRLAAYRYINQDVAIADAFACAAKVISALRSR